MKNIIAAYQEILEGTCVFQHVPRELYGKALSCLQARVTTFRQGQLLLAQGERTEQAGVVLSGSLEEYLYDENGNQVTIAWLPAGSVFGVEVLCAAQLDSQVYLRAATDCEILLLNFGVLLSDKTFSCPCRMQVSANLIQEFARQVVVLSTKIHILSQKKLRDKLKVFLRTQVVSPAGDVALNMNREQMAEFLCVDRSALSRELSRMRDEGILTWARNKITILDPAFLEG